MIRNVAAAIAGLACAFVLIMLIESLGHMIYPPPAEIDYGDAEVMQTYIAQLPILALLFPMLAWMIGTFAGALLASYIGTAPPLLFAGVVGGLVLVGTITNLILIPHPLWFAGLAILGIGVSAWLALQLAPQAGASDSTEDAG